MTSLLAIGAYEVAAILAARFLFYALRRTEYGPDDGFEAGLLCALMLMAGQFWPLALPVALVMWKPRKTPQELKDEHEAALRRIAELERELGIGGR